MSASKLKPCPWCGAKARLAESECGNRRGKHMVYCSNSGCAVHPSTRVGSAKRVVTDWNERAKEERP